MDLLRSGTSFQLQKRIDYLAWRGALEMLFIVAVALKGGRCGRERPAERGTGRRLFLSAGSTETPLPKLAFEYDAKNYNLTTCAK
jgi:hypothetical protein